MNKNTELKEIIGIPKNIDNVSQKLFDKLLEIFNDRLPNKLVNVEKLPEKLFLSMYSKIGDKKPFKISGVEINFNYREIPSHYGEKFLGMSVAQHSKIENKSFYRKKPYDDTKTITLQVDIGTPNNSINLIDFYNKYKVELISSFAHEFKHVYDTSVYNKEKITDRATYATSTHLAHNIPQETTSKLMYHVYYTTNIEQIVRNSEIGTALKVANVKTKQEFLKFLLNNYTINTLKEIINLDYNTFYNELLNDSNHILILMKNSFNYTGTDDKNKLIMDYLTKIKTIFEDFIFDYYKNEMVKNNPMISIFNQIDGSFDNEDFIKNHIKKYKNLPTKEFFQQLLRNNRVVARNTLRKIYKLYAIINED